MTTASHANQYVDSLVVLIINAIHEFFEYYLRKNGIEMETKLHKIVTMLLAFICVSCGGGAGGDSQHGNTRAIMDVPVMLNFTYSGKRFMSYSNSILEYIGSEVVPIANVWDGCERGMYRRYNEGDYCISSSMNSNAIFEIGDGENDSVVDDALVTRDPNSTNGDYRNYELGMSYADMPSTNQVSQVSKRFVLLTGWYELPDYFTVTTLLDPSPDSFPDNYEILTETIIIVETNVKDGVDENGFDKYKTIALVDRKYEGDFSYSFELEEGSPYWELESPVRMNLYLEQRLTVLRKTL